jgi:CheY-like chemotaxis protein
MNPILCLLIDDDSEESEIFQYALDELELHVKCYTVTSGKEAISIIANKQLQPQYIFLDLNMPRMNGGECLREIRKINAGANIPIYLYSTSFGNGAKEELETLGATGFITKTTNIFDLYAELHTIFSRDIENNSLKALQATIPAV